MSKKLNLGSGDDNKPGWINVDVDPSVSPDVIADLSQSLPFKKDFADEVLLQDVLEHFTKEAGKKLLEEVHRVLKPSGAATLRIPNVFQITKQFEDDPQVMMEFIYGSTEKNGVWGAHKFGYTREYLVQLLRYIGFKDVVIKKETTNYLVTCKKSDKPRTSPNILVIQQSPDWGGAEEWMLSLVGQFHKKGITTHVATNYDLFNKKAKKVSASIQKIPFTLDIIGNTRGLIKTILLFSYALLWYLGALSKYKKLGVNCILMSGFSEKLLVSWLANILGIKVVWYEYGPLGQVFKKNLYLPKVLYRLSKHIPAKVITISQNTKISLISEARVSLAKIKVIYPGTPIPRSKPVISSNSQIVGHLSRLSPEKGQRLLLKSWKIVTKKLPQAKLRIAGKGPDSEYLKSQAKKLNIEKSVEFVGFVSKKSAFYKSLSLFVFPGIWEMEGFGIAIIEALSFGVPVVAVDNGPAKEIVDSSIGRLSGRTPGKLADQIIGIIESGKTSQYSKSAYKKAKSVYSLDSQAQKVLDEISFAIYS